MAIELYTKSELITKLDSIIEDMEKEQFHYDVEKINEMIKILGGKRQFSLISRASIPHVISYLQMLYIRRLANVQDVQLSSMEELLKI